MYISARLADEYLANPSFEIVGHYHDWRNYISETAKKYWDELPKETRSLLYEQAEKQADMEEWE